MNPFPIIYPREIKTYGHTEVRTRMFIMDFFKIAPNWKQTKYSSAGGSIF